MRRRPVPLPVPRAGIVAAESAHAPGFATGPRCEPYHKLCYVLSGTVALQRGGRCDELPCGGLAVLPAGLEHELVDRAPAVLLLLGIGVEVVAAPPLREAWRLAARAPLRRCDALLRCEVEALWRRLLAETVASRPAGGAARWSGLGALLVRLARTAEEPAADAEARVAAVRDLIEERCEEAWSLDRAAALAGLARRRYSDLHRRVTGHSFVAWLTACRLQRAATLLEDGRTGIAAAAFASGFGDLAHFYRCFRRRWGTTPGQGRRRTGTS